MSVNLQAGLRQQNQGAFRHVLAAVLGSLVVFVAVCAAGAQLLVQSGGSGYLAAPASLTAQLAAALCAGWLSARMQGHGALFCAFAGFLPYGVVPAVMGALSGAVESGLFLGIRVGVILLASVLGALLGIHSHGKRKRVV